MSWLEYWIFFCRRAIELPPSATELPPSATELPPSATELPFFVIACYDLIYEFLRFGLFWREKTGS